MREDWNLFRFLLAIVRHGGASKAAESLGVSQPTVGRKISQLEEQLGVRLFDRTPSGYKLTELGKLVLAQADAMDELVRANRLELLDADRKPAGPVCITATEAVAQAILLPALTKFCSKYPEIELQIRISNRKLDLNRREADIAIRIGDPVVTDLIGCSVGKMTYGLYGAERYFDNMGYPDNIDALSHHGIVDADGEIATLPQARHLREMAPTAPTVLRCDTVLGQYHAMLNGVGLAPLPDYVATLGHGSCHRILESDFIGAKDVWLLTSDSARLASRVRVAMDFMKRMVRAHLNTSTTVVFCVLL